MLEILKHAPIVIKSWRPQRSQPFLGETIASKRLWLDSSQSRVRSHPTPNSDGKIKAGVPHKLGSVSLMRRPSRGIARAPKSCAAFAEVNKKRVSYSYIPKSMIPETVNFLSLGVNPKTFAVANFLEVRLIIPHLL